MTVAELSIIIPTKDRGDIFQKTLLAAYDATKNISAEIIVVNDSKTKDVLIEQKFSDRVKIFNNPKSGVASARNYGVKNAKYDNLLFLDDDIIINENNILELITLSVQYKNTAINFNWVYPEKLVKEIQKTQFGRYLIYIDYTSLKGWSKGIYWNDKNIFEVELVASYFLFLSKEIFNLIGAYNENFPHAGAEDFDFAMRLKQKGIKGYCYPLSTVFHNEEDRIELIPWLERKKRSAETRKIAANLGYKEMEIKSTTLKVFLAKLFFIFKNIIFFALELIPNKKYFNCIYFKITTLLCSAYLYKGYFNKK
ncbi:MAG: glycosyltransferase [Bacteroidetes bacterium]|nr:glycosyltransferase [Bacteroidota bacterium]